MRPRSGRSSCGTLARGPYILENMVLCCNRYHAPFYPRHCSWRPRCRLLTTFSSPVRRAYRFVVLCAHGGHRRSDSDRGTDGWTIASFCGLGPPLDLVTRTLHPGDGLETARTDHRWHNPRPGLRPASPSAEIWRPRTNNGGQTTDTVDPSPRRGLPSQPFLAAFTSRLA